MIQANEFRLMQGNWVNWEYDPNTYPNTYYSVQVTEIREDGIVHSNCIGDVVISYSNIQPIPLTPSILEAAGLKTEDPQYGEAWRLSDSRFIVRRVNYNKGFEAPDYGYAIELSTEKDWATIIDRCHHLHTLQNFFALTQTELTITLP